MDLRWVNTLFESGCCWPEYCMFLGSAQQGMCKLDRNSARVFCVSRLKPLSCNNLSPLRYRSMSTSPSLSPSSNSFFPDDPSCYLTPCWLGVPWLCRISSRKIQYLSQSVWVHSPLSLGVLPVALRWISPGLIDITSAMKYAYHDQRWWQVRRHLYRSAQAGVDVLLETKCLWITLCKAAALKINCSYTTLFECDLWM